MELRRRRVLAIIRLHDLRPVGAAAALLACAAAPLGAQSIEVTPLRVELAMTKGATHTQAVTLTNQGTEAIRIRARLQDWFMAKDGTPQFDAPVPEPETPFLATAWVRVAPPEQVVQPGQQAIVRFTTTAPKEVTDGGYRAAILFEFGPAGADPMAARRSVQFRSRVATLIYMNVGKPAVDVELMDLASRVRPGQPPAVIATLRNNGRANVRTKGSIVFRDASGKLVRTEEIPNVPLLPMAERDLAIASAKEGEAPLAKGNYRVEVKIDVGMPELIVGETTMTVP